MDFITPLLTFGASIFSAREARKSQEEANAREASYNMDEAEKSRQWQENMSNTAYQRARTDLEKAGYNPMLALGHPATTPAGAMASIHPKSISTEESDILSKASKNSMDVRLLSGAFDKVKEEIGLTKSQKNLIAEEARAMGAEADMKEQLRNFRTSKYGKFLMGLKETLDTGVSGLIGGVSSGFGALAGAGKIARAMRNQPRITIDPRAFRRD